MKKSRFVSFLLLIAMLISLFVPFAPVFAASDEKERVDYTKTAYETAEDKLHTMGAPVYSKGDLDMYYLADTGEVAVRNRVTGQILSTNPYNVGGAKVATGGAVVDSQKVRLLSQLIIKYKDSSNYEYEFDSYSYAALNDQIQMKTIKGGIRVEYAIGNSQKKRIVPRMISQTRFESAILATVKGLDDDDYTYKKLSAWYKLNDPNDPALTPRAKAEMLIKFPITQKFPIYTIDSEIKSRDLMELESYILRYTNYTLEDMLRDHDECGYVLEDDSPPLFKMALEYYLNEDGVTVNLPARGITYDMAKYKLLEVKILPYFGAAFEDDEGYLFIPDGSGAIIDFEDAQTYSTISGRLYGNDYSFYTVVGGNMQTWRLPVYGVVADKTHTELQFHDELIIEDYDDDGNPIYKTKKDENGDVLTDDNGDPVYETVEIREVVSESDPVREGFFAVVEEGESLAMMTAELGGALHNCNSCYITVYPRQSDSYPLDGITVSGQTATYEKDCERKYVGNFRTRYFMLAGDDASYVGMANTYRKYLQDEGVFPGETIHKDGDDITLYFESIGDIDTTEKILGVPVEVKTALTDTEDVQIMMELIQGRVMNLKAAEVIQTVFPDEFSDSETLTVEKAQQVLADFIRRSINDPVQSVAFIYKAWYNGGILHTPPSKISVDGAIGGEKKFKELAEYLSSQNIDFYPDLDYSFAQKAEWFDGFDYKTDTAKMIDGKPATQRLYDYIYQAVSNKGKALLSPAIYEKFFNNTKEKFNSLGTNGVSLSGIGSMLNSSQDEDLPVNREEAKDLTAGLLSLYKESGRKILIDGGNAYTVRYADAIVNAPLDSNNRVLCTHDIPFVGMVFHGYVDFTGEAINLAGDFDYTVLKTIESGASPYFMLSFENVAKLKEAYYTEYFAVRFDIWFDELLETYAKLNKALKFVAGSVISDHAFVADRVVKVTYSNGVSFLLNYNNFEVTVDGTTLAAMGFAKI